MKPISDQLYKNKNPEELKKIRQEFISEINKRLSLVDRFLMLVTGLIGVFNPGLIITLILGKLAKNSSPDVLRLFTALEELKD